MKKYTSIMIILIVTIALGLTASKTYQIIQKTNSITSEDGMIEELIRSKKSKDLENFELFLCEPTDAQQVTFDWDEATRNLYKDSIIWDWSNIKITNVSGNKYKVTQIMSKTNEIKFDLNINKQKPNYFKLRVVDSYCYEISNIEGR